MFVRTRIPKIANAVGFFAEIAGESYRMASLFTLHKNSPLKIANVPEIIAARTQHTFDHPVWKKFFTTSSTEWFGLDQSGTPCIVTLHSQPPFLNQNWLDTAYNKEASGKEHNLNTVPREMFLDVCKGAYGPVTSVTLKHALSQQNANKDPSFRMTKELALMNDLLCNRLGNVTHANLVSSYLVAHEQGSKAGLPEYWNTGENYRAYVECYPSDVYGDFVSYVSKGGYVRANLKKSPIDLSTQAVAHFICLGGVMSNGGTLASEVSLCKTDSNFAFLSIMYKDGDINFGKKVPYYSTSLYRDNIFDLFIPHFKHNPPEFFRVKKTKGCYLTQQHADIPLGIKEIKSFKAENPLIPPGGQFQYMVKHLNPLAQRTIKVPVAEGWCTEERVRSFFPDSRANAFDFLTTPEISGGYYTAKVEYYDAEIYIDRIVATQEQVIMDPELVGRIV